MLCRSSKSLLAITSGVTADQAGDAVTIIPRNDDVSDQEQSFVAVFNLTAAGGTSPTLDAAVETSWDGTVWHVAGSMTQLSGAGTKKQLVACGIIGPYVRATVTLGGTAVPTVTGTVDLASSGGLR